MQAEERGRRVENEEDSGQRALSHSMSIEWLPSLLAEVLRDADLLAGLLRPPGN
jgi:hypothetical protein